RKTRTLRSTLQTILKNTQVDYVVRGNFIILKRAKTKPDPIRYTISGTITDLFSGESMIGATVYLPDLKTGVTSNAYGFYSMTVPPGQYELAYSYIGYKSQSFQVGLSSNLKKDLELVLDTAQLAAVVIIPEVERDKNVTSMVMSAHKMDIKTFGELPYLYGEVDVVRGIKFLPGVSTVGEGAAGFNVRGGSIDQNLILLDEAPVYNSAHYFGLISVFNPDVVKNIQLYKGAIPARYGGAISSVLEVRQKEGNIKKFRGSGGIGIISARLTLEGPILKDKVSFLIAGRSSLGDPTSLGLRSSNFGENTAGFYDFNGKLNFNLDRKNSLYVSGYIGRDNTVFSNDVKNIWGNSTSTIRWNHIFSDKLFSNFTAVISKYDYQIQDFEGISKANWESNIINYNLKADFTYFKNSRHKWEYGASFVVNRYEPGEFLPDPLENTAQPFELEKEHSFEPSFYFSDEYQVNSRITLMVGLRYSLFFNLGEGQVFVYEPTQPKTINTITDTLNYDKGEVIETYHGPEPRVSIKYGLDSKSSLKLSYARTRQYNHLISNTTYSLLTDVWKLSGTHVKPQIADQVAFGYFRNFNRNIIETSVEVYFKKTRNVLDFKNGASLLLNQTIETEILQGEGRAYGLELMVSKPAGEFRGWASYSISRTERRIVGNTLEETINNGEYYPADYDQTHNIKLVGIYQLSRLWNVSANFIISSGRAITLPDAKYEYAGIVVPNFSERNQFRVPTQHRLDISATKMGKKRKWKRRKRRYKVKKLVGSWTFSLYNVYGRENVFSLIYQQNSQNSNEPQILKLPILGEAIPAITYNFRF
ncbi:MAG: TonB-dependent receptor, partial [Bacteroidetes bacterium]|nr:TonB-dependent receptor [Bacteroidota bacterium]